MADDWMLHADAVAVAVAVAVVAFAAWNLVTEKLCIFIQV